MSNRFDESQNPNAIDELWFVNNNKEMINVSNHPSNKWTDDQKKGYSVIHDLPFPNIAPTIWQNELDELVTEFTMAIMAIVNKNNGVGIDTHVMVMGEMVFTYRLVSALKLRGIICVASTSERMVVEKPNGEKTVRFEFKGWRSY